VYDGPTEQAIGRMHEVMQNESRAREDRLLQEGNESYTGAAEVRLDLVDTDGVSQRTFATGSSIVVRVEALFEEDVEDPLLGVMVAPLGLGTPGYATFTVPGAYGRRHGPGRPLEAEIVLENRMLAGGWNVTVGVHDGATSSLIGSTPPESFYVTSHHVHATGLVDLGARITVEGRAVETRAATRLRPEADEPPDALRQKA
jgi:hypothetical protein